MEETAYIAAPMWELRVRALYRSLLLDFAAGPDGTDHLEEYCVTAENIFTKSKSLF